MVGRWDGGVVGWWGGRVVGWLGSGVRLHASSSIHTAALRRLGTWAHEILAAVLKDTMVQ